MQQPQKLKKTYPPTPENNPLCEYTTQISYIFFQTGAVLQPLFDFLQFSTTVYFPQPIFAQQPEKILDDCYAVILAIKTFQDHLNTILNSAQPKNQLSNSPNINNRFYQQQHYIDPFPIEEQEFISSLVHGTKSNITTKPQKVPENTGIKNIRTPFPALEEVDFE